MWPKQSISSILYLAVVTETLPTVDQATHPTWLAHVGTLEEPEAHTTLVLPRLELLELLELVILLHIVDEGGATEKQAGRWVWTILGRDKSLRKQRTLTV